MPNVNIKKKADIEKERLEQWRESASVSRFQAKAIIHQYNLTQAVQDMMDDPETDAIVKLAWEDAQTFRRNSPTVKALAQTLELSDEQLDAMFEAASQIEA